MFQSLKSSLLILTYFLFVTNSLAEQDNASQINWMSWEDAMVANKANPKPIFIHIYAKWNGYCKMMDKVAFSDKGIIQYVNKHFYAVKLNGQHPDDITWKGRTFKFKKIGRRGIHDLSIHLVEDHPVYPTFIFLDANQDKQLCSKGYRKAEKLLPELIFIAEKQYEKYSLEEFINHQQNPIETKNKNTAIDKGKNDCNVLEFETQSLDFSTNADPNDVVMIAGVKWLKHNSNPNRELRIKNISDHPVRIFVKSNIGALIPKYTDEPIQPGEESIINVRYDTRRLGEQAMKLKIKTETCNYEIKIVARTIK